MLIAAFVSVTLSACGEEPNVAHSRVYGSWKLSRGDDPIVTEVYRYDPSAKVQDRFVGTPLRFSFPRHAYMWTGNLKGGAQSVIRVEYDQRTGRPIVEAIERENPGLESSDDVARIYNRAYGDRLLRIRIHMLRDYRMPEPDRSIKRFHKQTAKANVRVVSDHCGLDWYLLPDQPWQLAPEVPADATFDSLAGFDLTAIVEATDRPYVLNCNATSPICWMRSGFRGVPVEAVVRRNKICGHERYMRMVGDILDKHVIGR